MQPSFDTRMFCCYVIGTPAPQGSKNRGSHGQLYEASVALPTWRVDAVRQVQAAMRRDGISGYELHVPVLVDAQFRLRRPASLPRRVVRHSRKPDLDKLARALLDILVLARLLTDDGQVARLALDKRYTRLLEDPGCQLMVCELPQVEP